MFTQQGHTHTCSLPLHQNYIATGLPINTCLLKRNEKRVESWKKYGFSLFNVWGKESEREWLREPTSIMYTPTTSIKHLSRKINMGTDDVPSLSFLTEKLVCLEATQTHTHTHTYTVYKYWLAINHSTAFDLTPWASPSVFPIHR